MQKIIVALILAIAIFVTAVVYATNSTTDGAPIFVATPQVVAAVPAAPFTCAIGVRGWLIYVDDTNDTAEAYTCFCGVDADDATYIWLKVQDPAVDCF